MLDFWNFFNFAKPLRQVLTQIKIVLDKQIRKIIECEIGEEQQGFRKWRRTMVRLFTLMQFVESEKRL